MEVEQITAPPKVKGIKDYLKERPALFSFLYLGFIMALPYIFDPINAVGVLMVVTIYLCSWDD